MERVRMVRIMQQDFGEAERNEWRKREVEANSVQAVWR